MKGFFKPEDFNGIVLQSRNQEWTTLVSASEQANAKLNAEIETWPVVTGQVIGQRTILRFFGNEPNNETDTHTARLAFIEEIKPKECVHEPKEIKITVGTLLMEDVHVLELLKCKHCGIRLRAKWEVAE